MIRLSSLTAAVSALALASACAPQAQIPAQIPPQASAAQAPAPVPWRLADADGIETRDHLILTIALDDPEALAEAAAEIERRYGVALTAEWPLNSIAVHCLVIDVSGVADVEGLIASMRADGRIRTVQRMQDFQTLAVSYKDPLFPAQSALTRINAPRAQAFSTGEGVRIGVVDSGVDAAHPDLAARLAMNRDFVASGPARGAAAEPHGTAVAAVIGADAQNGIGMVGVAPGASLVGLRACWQQGASGRCSSFSLARALNFAILQKIPVLNLSLGGPPDPLLEELIAEAIARGTVIVAAWGEQGGAAFPASVPGVIGAGAGGVPAPQVDVLSAAPGGGYGYFSGSSVATAHVTGVAALMLALNPAMTPDQVARALRDAAAAPAGRPVLDACAALGAAESLPDGCLGQPSG